MGQNTKSILKAVQSECGIHWVYAVSVAIMAAQKLLINDKASFVKHFGEDGAEAIKELSEK